MTATWRLILDSAEPGAMNMALDRALLSGRAAGTSPPTLRLYRWARPTLTLGRFQDVSAVDLTEAAGCGVDVVRRPTGGRAVLHDDELTYAVVASTDDGVPRGVSSSYAYFATALSAAFLELGVEAAVAGATRGERGSSSCYLASTQADLVAGASKLSGSAQAWDGVAVLQHGSFTISRDLDLEASLLGLSEEHQAKLVATTCTLESVTGVRPDLARIEEAVVAGFESGLDIRLEPATYTRLELETAQDLYQRFIVAQA